MATQNVRERRPNLILRRVRWDVISQR